MHLYCIQGFSYNFNNEYNCFPKGNFACFFTFK
ncbi:hypothetical protein T05_15851 [Trichinella murrelli]|uniref:Uncharacterized protein n=1 Tax=Trichinella murrelli TaxID=144512 RepID=A0A0V0SQS2_9BILA|nr:hypothetical protein T05_7753 [Trichinella murrelli]KRX28907.1 hypothetical protein T05_15851 [Trichinella murrelli]